MNNSTQKPMTEAQAIAKAIGYTENGGKPDLSNPSSGKSGEMKSIFQFTPDTWKNDSQQVFGRSDVPLNNDTESYVTTQMVDKWLQKGYTPSQIFSMWNAGIGEPDAYTGKFSNGESSSGVNKQGVAYNVKSYVDTANKYLSEFAPQIQGGSQTNEPSLATNVSSTPPQNGGQQVTPQQYQQAISNIVGLVRKGQKISMQTGNPNAGLLPQLASAAPSSAPA